jgi:hypothetical protein
MEITAIRDRFIDHISTLEDLQDDMFTSLSELASPAYYNSNLPTFSKRIPLASPTREIETPSTATSKNYRSTQLKIIVEKWRNVLGKFREKIETSDSLQSGQHQEMISIIEESKAGGAHGKFPMILQPNLSPLEETLRRSLASKNKIVSGRLESALGLFQAMIKNTREVSYQQWLVTESSCDTQQVMIESLLKMFYRDLYGLSITLKHFYDKKLAVDARKFHVYTQHQKELALAHQVDSYKEMCKSIKSQNELYRAMIKCMEEEMESLPIKDRARSRKKLDELKSRNQGNLMQAEVYYEIAHKVVLPQSMSTVFYKLIRQWLYDFQKLLIENLSAMLTHTASTSASTSGSIEGAAGGTVQKSVLFNYAKRMDPTKLIDLASAGNFVFPSTDSINEVLLGFTQFHLNNNKQNLAYLKKNIDKMFVQYETLKGNVQEMVRVQQHFYTAKDSKLPSIQDAGAGASHGASPEVIKHLLKLDRDLKISDSRLRNMYYTLFNVMGGDYAKLEQQNKKLVEIVEFLKQYSLLMRDWEEKIKQEQLFIQKWKDVRKYNSRYMSLQFMEWNHFVTEEVDVFHKTIGLYSVSIFHKIKEAANDFMTQVLGVSNRRSEELEGEMKLVTNLYNDVRVEDLSFSDDLIRVQGQVEQWVSDTNYLYQVYFEHRLKTVIMYYLSALENLLDRFTDDSELGILLITLDNMYDLSAESIEEEKENRKSNFLQNKNMIV